MRKLQPRVTPKKVSCCNGGTCSRWKSQSAQAMSTQAGKSHSTMFPSEMPGVPHVSRFSRFLIDFYPVAGKAPLLDARSGAPLRVRYSVVTTAPVRPDPATGRACRVAGSIARLPLLFILIFARHVVFGHFTGANFLLVASSGVLDAGYDPCLERVAFLDQLVNTFRIGTFDVG